MPEWQPPWPPIRVGEAEWIIMRDSKRDPAGVIRSMRLGPRRELFYRVVTWAPTSEGRKLIGYYRSLQEADQSILFTPAVPPRRGPARPAPDGKPAVPDRTERD